MASAAEEGARASVCESGASTSARASRAATIASGEGIGDSQDAPLLNKLLAVGKRKRQQVSHLNIGDWHTQDYDRRDDGRGGPFAMAAAPVIDAASPTGAPEASSDKRQRISVKANGSLTRCAAGTMSSGCAHPTFGNRVGAAGAGEASEGGGVGGGSGSDGGGKTPNQSAPSRRLAMLLRRSALSARAKLRRGKRPRGVAPAPASPGGASSKSHSSSDENHQNRIPGMQNPMQLQVERSRIEAGTDRVETGGSVDWSAVGGLQHQVDTLKECVLHPLLYPELYQTLGVVPPRGVLLHGPPGCGKTLCARALAGSCQTAGLPVAFFARKGSDIQSKFVGEAEQRLCALFETARKSAPSIIFFDELDGLAPTRSDSGTEGSSHSNSLVTTLLALMDGLESRGQVVILGATNRPDMLDSALRRPGRFDRELRFDPPTAAERLQILEVHTRRWPSMSKDSCTAAPLQACLQKLANERSAGLSGADLRAICANAAIRSIRRTFPQIYKDPRKLQLNPEHVQVTEGDFEVAADAYVASSARGTLAAGACVNGIEVRTPMPLSPQLSTLLDQSLVETQQELARLFLPWGASAATYTSGTTSVLSAPFALLGARVIVNANSIRLLRLLEPSLLVGSEIPIFRIDIDHAVHAPEGTSTRVARTFAAAVGAAPSAVVISGIERWGPGAQGAFAGATLDVLGCSPATILLQALEQMPVEAPVLVLATAHEKMCAEEDVPINEVIELEDTTDQIEGADSAALAVSQNCEELTETQQGRKRRQPPVASRGHPAVKSGGDTARDSVTRAGTAVLTKHRRGRGRTSWTKLLDLFQIVTIPSPGVQEAHQFFHGLLVRGLKFLLDKLLEEQQASVAQPHMQPVDEGEFEEARLQNMKPEEVATEEREEQYWERLFRNQVRQVLQALARYTRFMVFNVSEGDMREASTCSQGLAIEGPLTLGELMRKNDAHKYASVENVRADVRQLCQNVREMFPDPDSRAEQRVRAAADELVDKAEAKLDCIDEEVVRFLARMRARKERRNAAQQRLAEKKASDTAPAAPAAPAVTYAKAKGMADNSRRLANSTGETRHSSDLPDPFADAVEHEVKRLLRLLPEVTGTDEWFAKVLELGKHLQRSICSAMVPQQGPGRPPGRQAYCQLKSLTDSFFRDYSPQEHTEGLNSAKMLARRAGAFRQWLREKERTRLAQKEHQKFVQDAVAALAGDAEQAGSPIIHRRDTSERNRRERQGKG